MTSEDERFVVASADGVVLMEEDDGLCSFVPVEIKTRAASTIYTDQINKIATVSSSGAGANGEGAVALIHMDYNDPQLHSFVKDYGELAQILHHAVVYSADNCYLLIGSPRSS
jgi:hypothetical protein